MSEALFDDFAGFEREEMWAGCDRPFRMARSGKGGRLALIVTLMLLVTASGAEAQFGGGNPFGNRLVLSGDLPQAKVKEAYEGLIQAGGGMPPFRFALVGGALPPGIMLDPTNGMFRGDPTMAGRYTFSVQATDATDRAQGTQSFSIEVGSKSSGGNSTIKVSVSPTGTTLSPAQTKQFTATISGTSNTGVTWSATSGSIDANGNYTAPSASSSTSATVTATSQADPSKTASATVTVDVASVQALTITSSSLPRGQQGASYSGMLTASGGTSPYIWSVSSGAIPAGVTMQSSGELSGTPTASGNYTFTVTVTDAANRTANAGLTSEITAGSNYDGPAELPRVTVASAMSDTPAPGAVVNVNSGGDLQAALNNAQCGDTIQLQAGATFTGQFTVPAKGCDAGHWIVVRTSAADSALPAEGERTTPCYAGVASLVGRPAYNCPSTSRVLAKVQLAAPGDGPFKLASGADFYRFLGLEITRAAGTPASAVLISTKGTADHIVIDRSWLHGLAQDETQNGISLDGMTNVAVVDSYFNDFHCISTSGKCTDAHAISGGVSETQDGPYKIQDNFLEASGEAVMFGGGAATATPADIQILNNHMWKPWQWMKGHANFVGGADGNPFTVKNHMELKNAVRVLAENNLMENDWGGFSQSGYGILLTPKNQHTQQGADVCPLCQVTDITIRYVHISHVGGGIQMATALGGNGTDGAPALAGARWSIHDVVIDDISTSYVGSGTVFEILNDWPKNALNTVTINHVTAFPDTVSHMMTLGNTHAKAPMTGLVFTNNLVMTGQHPVWNTGGGSASCAYTDVPATSISRCFSSWVFSNNALVAAPSSAPPSSWPAQNMFPQSVSDVEFADFSNGINGNYELQASSPYKGKGSDGKDLGADVAGLTAALAGVE